MKAVLLHEFGDPDRLQYSDFPTPEINPNQLLIRIAGVSLNHLDLFVREGIPGIKLKLPHILGSDISGEIIEIGSNISSNFFSIGQKIVVDPSISCGVCEFCCQGDITLCKDYGIIGEHIRGGYAENIAISPQNAIPIPSTSPISLQETAAVPLTFMTAWKMIMTRARLKVGEDVLITGIGGGVALASLQIVKLLGARTFVTSSSDEKLKRAKTLGADFTINYNNTSDYDKEIWKLTNKRGVDVVIDSAGKVTWEKSMRSLRKGGRLVTCGATTGPIASTNLNLLFWKQLDLLGSTMGNRSELREVLKHVWNGKLKPIIDSKFSLKDAKKAHQKLEKGKQFGKIILVP